MSIKQKIFKDIIIIHTQIEIKGKREKRDEEKSRFTSILMFR